MQTKLRHSAASSYVQPAGVEVRPHQQQRRNTSAMVLDCVSEPSSAPLPQLAPYYPAALVLHLQAEGGRAFGTVYYVSGAQYKGEWRDNKRHGVCVVTPCDLLSRLQIYLTAQQQFLCAYRLPAQCCCLLTPSCCHFCRPGSHDVQKRRPVWWRVAGRQAARQRHAVGAAGGAAQGPLQRRLAT